MSNKKSTALLSVFSNTGLIILKFVVGAVTGSVSIISEAVHSMMDLAAAVVAFFSVRIADKPADERHPYGHEKVENVSGVVEGLLILAAAGWIIWESVGKLMHAEAVKEPGLGLAVMAVSAAVNTLVAARLYKVAKAEDSVALEADALHLKADVITSLGVAAGMGLLWITGWYWVDPVAAILVAIFILKEAAGLMAAAFHPLMDHRLSEEEEAEVRAALEEFKGEFLEFHALRTRKSGRMRHIDFHLTMHRNTPLEKAHSLCDRMEAAVAARLRHTHVLIHTETCGPECLCPQ